MTGFSFRHPLLVNRETMEMIDEEKKKGMKFYGLNIGDHMDEGCYGFPIPPLSCGRMIPGLSVLSRYATPFGSSPTGYARK